MYKTDNSGETWSEKQKLLASDGAAEDRFGYSVAIHGDVIVGGALYNDHTAIHTGMGRTIIMYFVFIASVCAMHSCINATIV